MKPFEAVKFYVLKAYGFASTHFSLLLIYSFILFLGDLTNYALQSYVITDEEMSRYSEIGIQFFLIFVSVVFLHHVHCRVSKRECPYGTVFGEALLLLPGYILQSLLMGLLSLGGAFLFVLPGLYFAIVFYMAPMLALIYPDYNGKTFLLARELSHKSLGNTLAMVMLCGLLPLIPQGLLWLSTGSLNTMWSLIYSPVDSMLYLFLELVFFFFVYDLVTEDRKLRSA